MGSLFTTSQGYSQVKGMDYADTFVPVARLEAIRLLLAYASFHDFKLYQMDVKSAFLNGPLKEVAYVAQPPVSEDPHYPNHVYSLPNNKIRKGFMVWFFCRSFCKKNPL
jgi:hypothetical protein